jgi:hypothetical protein
MRFSVHGALKGVSCILVIRIIRGRRKPAELFTAGSALVPPSKHSRLISAASKDLHKIQFVRYGTRRAVCGNIPPHSFLQKKIFQPSRVPHVRGFPFTSTRLFPSTRNHHRGGNRRRFGVGSWARLGGHYACCVTGPDPQRNPSFGAEGHPLRLPVAPQLSQQSIPRCIQLNGVPTAG